MDRREAEASGIVLVPLFVVMAAVILVGLVWLVIQKAGS